MKVTEAQNRLSMYGGATAARAESIATELRGAGMLPKGGRGPFAPDATFDQIAHFALAIAGAERVSDAANVALALGNLVDQSNRPLLHRLSEALRRPKRAAEIRHVRVLPTSDVAELLLKTGKTIFFAPPEKWADQTFNEEAQGQGFVGRIGHIGGAVLVQIAMEIEDDEAEVVVGEQVS